MKTADIIRIRLHNQQLSNCNFNSPKEIVSWMGMMQAQEYASSKWAIGVRLPQSTQKSIDQSLDNADIIRTHVLRPTWHYVSPEDIYWLLDLSAPQQKQAMKSREKILELSPAVYNKSNKAIEKALSNGEHLTRKEIVARLKEVKIDAQHERGGFMLFRAEIESIICSGKQKGKEITYALLSERVPSGKTLPREEALAKLAIRFFTSHGPATVQDFIWWSGLSITEGKAALEMVKKDFVSEKDFWFSSGIQIPENKKASCFLLPPYDEYIIGYADRTAVIDGELKNQNIFENGLYRNTIVVNGKAIGNWKKGKASIEVKYFKKPGKTTLAMVKKEMKGYERFMGKG